MSKHKHKQKKQDTIAQSVAALTAAGLKAFRQNDYLKAILSWERAPANLRPAAWLAEAHFRHGLALFYGPASSTGMSYLQTAASYQPNNPCYAYHVGLALHRLGDLPGALTAYQRVRQSLGPFTTRAAYPMALILLQNGQDPTTAPVWNDLTAEERNILRSVSAFRRRPYILPPEAPLIWHALAAFERNDHAQAQAGLENVLAGNSTAAEKKMAHYYLGILAARVEDWDAACRAWDAAAAAGLRSSRLHNNLAEIYHRRAEDLLKQGDAQSALAAVAEARRHRSGDKALDELLNHIHQHLGYQAAAANRWDEAQSHWQTAVELDSASFRLAYNLALAHEKSGDYILAGQTWREALRRRPRRTDHPDVLSDDEVARLWQRAAECYSKAGDFDEVGHIYQQAIKWAPENLDLRLALAESLITEGRLQAARNELERLLEHDPKHVPALLRLGEAFFRDENSPWYVRAQAKVHWEKALLIEPKNAQVPQMLAEWYMSQAEIDLSWGRFSEAIEKFQKAIEYQPKNIKALLALALCHIKLKDEPRGEEYVRQALALAVDFDDFVPIIVFWLSIKRSARALELTIQAEARFGKVPVDFYIAMAENLIEDNQKEEVQPWLQRAIEKAVPEDVVFIMIGEMAMDIDIPLAHVYLQKALDAKQEPGHAHMLLGLLESRRGNLSASKKHFSEAERIARQTRDDDLAEKLEIARSIVSEPVGFLRRLLESGDSEMLADFLDDLDDEDD